MKAVITFEYDPEAVPSPEELRIYYFDTRQNVWVEIGGEVNSQTHTITVQVGHFTTFAALIPRVEAPALPELPAEVRSDRLTAAGAAPAGTPVSLVINGEAQATAVTGDDGRYVLEGRLAEGQNWVYVKGMGALASREWPVAYRPAPVYTDTAGHWAGGHQPAGRSGHRDRVWCAALRARCDGDPPGVRRDGGSGAGACAGGRGARLHGCGVAA